MKTQTIKEFPRVLIVGTTPYNPNEASRALDTYFHNWPKDKLRMIFSNTNIPQKWRYSSLYQITDYDVLNVMRKKSKAAGRIFNDEDLPEASIKDNNAPLSKYKKKTIRRYYLRKFLWKRKRWLSEELIKWVDEFKPEIIYICFSDDYFILDIADYFASKHHVPVISQIGDDYYFKKYNFLLRPYLSKYRKLFRRIMSKDGFGVYISDKLANKYNESFSIQGVPFYLASSIVSKKNDIKYEFNYFGKLDLGRYKSLCLLGDALKEINNNYHINVYSGDNNKKIVNLLTKHNCLFNGEIDYSKVQEMMNSGSFNIIASGFDKKGIEASRYSLSTKVSDSLSSSGPIIVIGGKGDGAVDFFLEKKCSITLTDKKIDANKLKEQLDDRKQLEKNISEAQALASSLFKQSLNTTKFETMCYSYTIGKEK